MLSACGLGSGRNDFDSVWKNYSVTRVPMTVDLELIRHFLQQTGISDISLDEVENTWNYIFDFLKPYSLKPGQSISLEVYLNDPIKPNPPFIVIAEKGNWGAVKQVGVKIIGLPDDFRGRDLVVDLTGTVERAASPSSGLQIKVDKVNRVTDVGPVLTAIKEDWRTIGSNIAKEIGADIVPDNFNLYFTEATHELIVQASLAQSEQSAFISPFGIRVLYFAEPAGSIKRIRASFSSPRILIPDSPGPLREARDIALLLGGRLQGPAGLKNTVKADLEAIRTAYGDEFPQLRSIRYFGLWNHSFHIVLNDASQKAFLSGV
jgi:hypothetical protein